MIHKNNNPNYIKNSCQTNRRQSNENWAEDMNNILQKNKKKWLINLLKT